MSISDWLAAPIKGGQEGGLTKLDALSGGLSTFGAAMQGRPTEHLTRDWQNRKEEESRKAAIKGLMGDMGISGPERGLLETMPAASQQAFLLSHMQQQEAERRARGRAGAAAAKKAAEQATRDAQWKAFMGETAPSAPGGFATAQAAPSAGLSLPSMSPEAAIATPPPIQTATVFSSQGGGLPAPIASPDSNVTPRASTGLGVAMAGPDQGLSFPLMPQAARPAPTAPSSKFDRYNKIYGQMLEAPPGMYDPKVLSHAKGVVDFHRPKDREMYEAADGYNYWVDAPTERVNPDITVASGPVDPKKEAQISRLIEGGLTRNEAIGIVDGRYELSQLGEVIDVSTGLPIGHTEAAPSGVVQEAQPGQTPELGFGSSVPKADYNGAFGASGFGANILNKSADLLGIDQPAPEIQQASTALTNVALRTVTIMQDAFPGRTSVQLMQKLEEVAARPGKLLTGDQESKDTLQQTASMLKGLIDQERNKITNPIGYTPTMRAEARSKIDQLEPLLADYKNILSQMNGGGGQQKTTSGISWEIEQ